MTGRTSITGSILKDYSEKYDAEYLEVISNVMNKTGVIHGIYVLYNDEQLYYIGKSIDLKTRIQNHMKNKHKGKWNKFRIFLIKNREILDDLETILIIISSPIGNGNKGIFPIGGELDRKIKDKI